MSLLGGQYSNFISGGLFYHKALQFSVTGGLVYAVNGPTSPQIPVRGFTLDPRSETALDTWGPAAVSTVITRGSFFIPFNLQMSVSFPGV
jgi:hypothetical protein